MTESEQGERHRSKRARTEGEKRGQEWNEGQEDIMAEVNKDQFSSPTCAFFQSSLS